MIRLLDHATLSNNVCLVCMAQQDAMFPAQTCTVTGYGVGDIPAPMLKGEAPRAYMIGVEAFLALCGC